MKATRQTREQRLMEQYNELISSLRRLNPEGPLERDLHMEICRSIRQCIRQHATPPEASNAIDVQQTPVGRGLSHPSLSSALPARLRYSVRIEYADAHAKARLLTGVVEVFPSLAAFQSHLRRQVAASALARETPKRQKRPLRPVKSATLAGCSDPVRSIARELPSKRSNCHPSSSSLPVNR